MTPRDEVLRDVREAQARLAGAAGWSPARVYKAARGVMLAPANDADAQALQVAALLLHYLEQRKLSGA